MNRMLCQIPKVKKWDTFFVARHFQAGHKVIIYIGVQFGGNEVSGYLITNKCDKNPVKLKLEGGYPEVK